MEVKPETGRQILDINNAASYFIKLYSIVNRTELLTEMPMNYTRYRMLKFRGEPYYVFFKFSRNPYFMAREGMSETVNVKEVKRLVQFHNMDELRDMYFALDNGYVYTIPIKDFLMKSYIEVEERSEQKAKYVIAYKHMKRWNR